MTIIRAIDWAIIRTLGTVGELTLRLFPSQAVKMANALHNVPSVPATDASPAGESDPPSAPPAGHPDRVDQIRHATALIEDQIENRPAETPVETATRIVDMLAADWRIVGAFSPTQ